MDGPLEDWCGESMDAADTRFLTRWDEWSEQWRVALHVQYADDTARVGTEETPTRLARNTIAWHRSFGGCLRREGVAQNDDKLQMLLQLAAGRKAHVIAGGCRPLHVLLSC